jgi:DNA-binding NarL/FixJ family response regulator
MSTLRILVADDHAVVRAGVKALIQTQPDMEVIGEAADGRTVVEQALAYQPDIVILDLSMPEVNGAQVTARLTQACPQVKVVALTVHADTGYLQQVLHAGASGYVLKLAAADELIRAIRVVAAGGVYLDPTMAGKLVGRSQRQPAGGVAQEHRPLSERETEVLCLLAWGYSNKEIAARLTLSTKTVETYKARLMEKLEVRSRVDLVRYAIRHGWLHETPPP